MTTCVIEGCQRARVKDALYCHEHLNDAWGNRAPVAREPEWLRRRREQGLPPKDTTWQTAA